MQVLLARVSQTPSDWRLLRSTWLLGSTSLTVKSLIITRNVLILLLFSFIFQWCSVLTWYYVDFVYRYCIVGDGCNMEGISNEAASLAGHWGLGKLITFYDDNHISIDGDTEIAFTEDVSTRFEALGWHTIWVKNGNDGYDEIRKAIQEAKSVTDKPTMIKVIFFGYPGIILVCCCKVHHIYPKKLLFLGDYYNRFWISQQDQFIPSLYFLHQKFRNVSD